MTLEILHSAPVEYSVRTGTYIPRLVGCVIDIRESRVSVAREYTDMSRSSNLQRNAMITSRGRITENCKMIKVLRILKEIA